MVLGREEYVVVRSWHPMILGRVGFLFGYQTLGGLNKLINLPDVGIPAVVVGTAHYPATVDRHCASRLRMRIVKKVWARKRWFYDRE